MPEFPVDELHESEVTEDEFPEPPLLQEMLVRLKQEIRKTYKNFFIFSPILNNPISRIGHIFYHN